MLNHSIFSKICVEQVPLKSFKDYIFFLKLAQNTRTISDELINLVYKTFFYFVKQPHLFQNAPELFEVDELHQNLYERAYSQINVDKDENSLRFNR